MKTTTTMGWMLLGIAAFSTGLAAAREGAPEKVGVYDSRAVAYAHFWSPGASKERDEAVAAAKAAKAAGDSAGFSRKSRALSAHQERMHAQVFSSAPADEALAALAARMPALLRELGVARLVSQWDGKALQQVPAPDRVDVTDRLVREFITPTDQQQKVLDSMKTKKPVTR